MKDEAKQVVLEHLSANGKQSVNSLHIDKALDANVYGPRVLEALSIVNKHRAEFNTDEHVDFMTIDGIRNWNTMV